MFIPSINEENAMLYLLRSDLNFFSFLHVFISKYTSDIFMQERKLDLIQETFAHI